MVTKKGQEYLEKVTAKIEKLGYESFEDYLASRLSMTLREISEELDESYYVFQRFHNQFIREKIDG